MSLCPYTYVLLKNRIVSNAPPLGQQTARKSPRNPPPYPVLGVVGRDNRRISHAVLSGNCLHVDNIFVGRSTYENLSHEILLHITLFTCNCMTYMVNVFLDV